MFIHLYIMATVSEIYINPDSQINNNDINVGKDQLGLCVRVNIPNGTVSINNIWTATGLPGGLKPNTYIFVNNNVGNCDILLPVIGTTSTSASFGHEMQINNDPSSLGTITIQSSTAAVISVVPIGGCSIIRATNTGTNIWSIIANNAVSSGGPATPIVLGFVYGLTESNGADANTALGFNALLPFTTTGLGNFNTAVGYEAGSAIPNTSDSNVLVGYRSGQSITGDSNIIVGNLAGQTGSGNNNVYIGLSSGAASGTGTQRVFIGYQTGIATTGDNNTLIGYQAGNSLTTGASNTILGSLAGSTIGTTAATNILIGPQAGQSITGTLNIMIGNSTGPNCTGNSNILIGSLAGNSLTTGGNNTIIGIFAGNSIGTTAANNVLIGISAGSSITGTFNIIIGPSAGQNSSASNNVYIGGSAGQTSGAGIRRVFVGHQTGPGCTGDNNTLLGFQAGNTITTGTNNTLIGNSAGFGSAVASANNTFVGNSAGSSNTGSSNTIIGSSAGQTSSGSNNVYIGLSSGNNTGTGTQQTFVGGSTGIATTGDNNTLIGYQAGNALTTGTSNTLIGNQAGLTIGVAVSNTTLIGSSTNSAFNGSIGLGTGAIPAAANQFVFGSAGTPIDNGFFWKATAASNYNLPGAGTALAVDTATGQIGISTSSRRYKENIIPFNEVSEFKSLDITNLNPVVFNYKSNKDKSCIGLIAEDVDKAGFKCIVNYISNVKTTLIEKEITDEEGNTRIINENQINLDDNDKPIKLDNEYDDYCPDNIDYQLLSVLLLKEVKELKLAYNDVIKKIENLEKNKISIYSN